MAEITQSLSVDFSKTLGPVREIHGINLGPIAFNGIVDNSAYFKEAAFPLVRLHDAPLFYKTPVVDIPYVFPLEHLDSDDPENYRFKVTDSYIQAILDCGCPILYRLGVSIEPPEKFRHFTDPPQDVEKWIDIASHIIRHYNEGWADGFHHGIEYWEIWNEPDNGPNMWNGSFAEFIDFYIQAAKALKERFPHLKIGGPAFNGGMRNHAQQKLEEFLPPLLEAGAPLDFLSWHIYPRYPEELIRPAYEVREILDSHGFKETESHLNEWNIGPVDHDWKGNANDPLRQRDNFHEMRSPRNSALVAACLTAFQDAPLDMSNFYHGSCTRRGIFDEFGIPYKPFYAFKAFRRLIEATPLRVHVSGSDPDHGLAVLPAISEDRKTAQLLLANFDNDRERWSLSLDNLPFEDPTTQSWIIDQRHDLEPAPPNAAVLTQNELTVRIPRPSVSLVQFVSGSKKGVKRKF